MSINRDNIAGKVVVITGASSGLGEATARYLAHHEATVVLGARRVDRLQALVDEITRAGGKALALATDVTRAAQVQALVDACDCRVISREDFVELVSLRPAPPSWQAGRFTRHGCEYQDLLIWPLFGCHDVWMCVRAVGGRDCRSAVASTTKATCRRSVEIRGSPSARA
jgi:short subunit dehydrogenase